MKKIFLLGVLASSSIHSMHTTGSNSKVSYDGVPVNVPGTNTYVVSASSRGNNQTALLIDATRQSVGFFISLDDQSRIDPSTIKCLEESYPESAILFRLEKSVFDEKIPMSLEGKERLVELVTLAKRKISGNVVAINDHGSKEASGGSQEDEAVAKIRESKDRKEIESIIKSITNPGSIRALAQDRAKGFGERRANPISMAFYWASAYEAYVFRKLSEGSDFLQIMKVGGQVDDDPFMSFDDEQIVPYFRKACEDYEQLAQAKERDWIEFEVAFKARQGIEKK